MSLDVHAVATTRLRSDGQRYTTGRRALVTALLASARPVTIPQLLDHGRGLAQSSVYRNLAVLERAGVVHRIVTADDFARYELAEDLTEHHHHHLICSRCGEVADFTLPAPLERELDAAAGRVAKRTGFAVDRHQLDLVGTCPACR